MKAQSRQLVSSKFRSQIQCSPAYLNFCEEGPARRYHYEFVKGVEAGLSVSPGMQIVGYDGDLKTIGIT